jgi:hypothetical protein
MRKIFCALPKFKRWNQTIPENSYTVKKALLDTATLTAYTAIVGVGSYVAYNFMCEDELLSIKNFYEKNIDQLHEQAIDAGMESLQAHLNSPQIRTVLDVSPEDIKSAKIVSNVYGDHSYHMEYTKYVFPRVCEYNLVAPERIEKSSCSWRLWVQENRVDFLIPFQIKNSLFALRVTMHSIESPRKDPQFYITAVDLFDSSAVTFNMFIFLVFEFETQIETGQGNLEWNNV